MFPAVMFLLLAAAPVIAVPPAVAVPANPQMAGEHRSWIDDQARWNAQHMAAARRLEAVAAALRRHDTSFDRHGSELRDHNREVVSQGHDGAARTRHDRLRAAHVEAGRSHRRLMADVADLESTIADNLAADRFR